MKHIEQMIDEQIKKWEKLRSLKYRSGKVETIVTFSREPGSGGSIIAKMLADQLGLDFFHREIIQKMAESAGISERLMELLDEKGMTVIDDWISTFINEKHLWPDQHLRHLLHIIGSIARHGGAVIVGRGAGFILPPAGNFRVRVIAPLLTKIQNVAGVFNISAEQAKQRVLKTESDRSAFVRKYFHVDVADPVNYDLVLNTGRMTMDAAVDSIKGALIKFQSDEEIRNNLTTPSVYTGALIKNNMINT